MNDDIKQNLKEPSIWSRALYMLIFAFFYSVAEVVMFAVVVIQFFMMLITGETNPRLLKLGQNLATYIFQIIQYLSFNSEYLVYPFGAWPGKASYEKVQEQIQDDN